MGTKNRILKQSRDLFNAKGVQATTLRQIALALGMSQGNLNYHFKAKQDIVECLYFELVEKLDAEMATMTQQFYSMSMLYLITEKTMYIFYEYRFLLRDMYLIFRENESMKEHYIKLQVVRKGQFAELFDLMIKKEVLREEAFPNEYERLYERMMIVGDNWINASELFKTNEDNPVKYYQGLLFEMIFPYLTKTGKKEYSRLFS